MRRSEKQDFVDAVRNKQAPSLPPIDSDRYTELPGLEGPFRLRSGKVVYYDPKEGKYYDRDRDMYIDYDEYESHANPRESVGFYRFCQILEEGSLWNRYGSFRGSREEDGLPEASGQKEFTTSLVLKNGVMHDVERNKPLAAIPSELVRGVIGAPNDTYTLTAIVTVKGHYMPGYDYGGGDADSDELVDDVEIEEAEVFIVNDRTNEEVFVPGDVAFRLFGQGPKFVYEINDLHVQSDKIHFNVG